jgi:hypothetical protein
VHRVAAPALLLSLLACLLSAGSAGAATRPVAFVPMVAPAIGTCAAGDPGALRLLIVRDATTAAEAAPCLGGVAPRGRALLVLAPDATATGTTVAIRRVELVGRRGQRTLQVTVAVQPPPADALLAQVLATPRAAVRLGGGPLPRAWRLVDESGRLLARRGA